MLDKEIFRINKRAGILICYLELRMSIYLAGAGSSPFEKTKSAGMSTCSNAQTVNEGISRSTSKSLERKDKIEKPASEHTPLSLCLEG